MVSLYPKGWLDNMENGKIFITSSNHYIQEDFEKGFLDDAPYKNIVETYPGVGGDWPHALANIIRNEIVMTIGTAVAADIIVDCIRKTYNYYKNRKSTKQENLKDSKIAVFPNGDIVIKIKIENQYIGSVGKENIDLIKEEFINEILSNFKTKK